MTAPKPDDEGYKFPNERADPYWMHHVPEETYVPPIGSLPWWIILGCVVAALAVVCVFVFP